MFGGKRRARYLRVRESVLKNVTRMENDIPKIDLPQDWVIGKLTEKDLGLLNLYANYPCRLKAGIFLGVSAMYKAQTEEKAPLTKAEQISQNFAQLVTQNYTRERNVAWYAKRLGITQAHLSTIVRQTTGRTCVEIITSMVIMDAKAQLKSTDLSIHDIAYSLNFTNMSFFGKYFKRYVGMGPLEYRKS